MLPNSDYADTDNLFFALDQTFTNVHYGFIYNSNSREIECKQCAWYHDEVDFLDAVRLHADHRTVEKLRLLDAFRATLSRSET